MMTLNIINVKRYHLLVSFKMWREPVPGFLSFADDMGGNMVIIWVVRTKSKR